MKEDSTKILIEYRLQQAQAALKDGRILIDEGGSVAGIVNRAYYAMFYAALALMQNIGKAPSKHAGVITLFDTEFVIPGLFPKDMSKSFHKIFELRQSSDYKATERPDHHKAEEAYRQSVFFVKEIEHYLRSLG